jgi:hypothetical protein
VHEFRQLAATLSVGRNRVQRAWEGLLPTGQKLWIAEKKDHKLLLVLYQESKPLIYLPGHEHKELAMKVLVKIANEYIKNPCEKANLKILKATMWKAELGTLVTMKRPAAALTEKVATPAEKAATPAETTVKKESGTNELKKPPAKVAKVNVFGDEAVAAAPKTPPPKPSASSSSSSRSAFVPEPQVAPAPTTSFMDDVYS